MDNRQESLKTAMEIGSLAIMLNVKNQSYVLNTINALLFSQEINDQSVKNKPSDKTA